MHPIKIILNLDWLFSQPLVL